MIIYLKATMPKCNKCKRDRDASYFVPRVNRRTKLTVRCSICRNTNRRSDINPTTKVGKCRGVYQTWKGNHSCENCGITDSRLIEADHQAEKVHRCSHYVWWVWNGGVEALKAELLKCKPLCRFCHALKSQAERKKQKQARYIARQKIINAEKLKRGACLTCKRKVTLRNACAFDFDHLDPETKRMNVSHMVLKSWDYFNAHAKEEMRQCSLLCTNCHHIKTNY
jgi:hypothetical protein